jgi:hypothetical protein
MNTKDSKSWGERFIAVLGKKTKDGDEKVEKGGPGSGHFGHAGRPGKVGGSAPSGVQVGRRESPESDAPFKWSGKAQLKRKRGPNVNLSVSSNRRSRRFEVHGAVDARGRTKRGKAAIRVGNDTVELDHDELHDLRSKMRYLNMARNRDVTHIAGKKIARGDSIDVEVGKRKVSIPVNDQSVREVDRAAHAAKRHGFSFTAESRRQVRMAYEQMVRGKNPIQVVKDLGFSKAGKAAAIRAYVDGPGRTRKALASLIDSKRGVLSESSLKTLRSIGKKFYAMRKEAWEARKQRSGTDSMAAYFQAAAMWDRIEQAGARKRRK